VAKGFLDGVRDGPDLDTVGAAGDHEIVRDRRVLLHVQHHDVLPKLGLRGFRRQQCLGPRLHYRPYSRALAGLAAYNRCLAMYSSTGSGTRYLIGRPASTRARISVLLMASAGISIVCTLRRRSPNRWFVDISTDRSRWYPGRLAAMNWQRPSRR